MNVTRDAYGYGNNNPIRYSDPSGLAADPVDWLVQLLLSSAFERVVIQHSIEKYGGGSSQNWQKEVVIHGARDGGDGRADAINFSNGDLLEFKGVSGKESENRQRRLAREQLDDYESGWSDSSVVVPRCSSESCPGSIARDPDFMPAGKREVITLSKSNSLTYWQDEAGIVFWEYSGNNASKLAALGAAHKWLNDRKKKERVLEPAPVGAPVALVGDERDRPQRNPPNLGGSTRPGVGGFSGGWNFF